MQLKGDFRYKLVIKLDVLSYVQQCAQVFNRVLISEKNIRDLSPRLVDKFRAFSLPKTWSSRLRLFLVDNQLLSKSEVTNFYTR